MKKTAIAILAIILIAVMFCGCGRYGTTAPTATISPHYTPDTTVPNVTAAPRITATPKATVSPNVTPRIGDGAVTDKNVIPPGSENGAVSPVVLP